MDFIDAPLINIHGPDGIEQRHATLKEVHENLRDRIEHEVYILEKKIELLMELSKFQGRLNKLCCAGLFLVGFAFILVSFKDLIFMWVMS